MWIGIGIGALLLFAWAWDNGLACWLLGHRPEPFWRLLDKHTRGKYCRRCGGLIETGSLDFQEDRILDAFKKLSESSVLCRCGHARAAHIPGEGCSALGCPCRQFRRHTT